MMPTTYTTKAGITRTITETIDGLFDAGGCDGCNTLEEAKELLEWMDSDRSPEIEAFNQHYA